MLRFPAGVESQKQICIRPSRHLAQKVSTRPYCIIYIESSGVAHPVCIALLAARCPKRLEDAHEVSAVLTVLMRGRTS